MWQGKNRGGVPQPITQAPPKRCLRLQVRSHRDASTTQLGLRQDLGSLGVPMSCSMGPCGLLCGSPWAPCRSPWAALWVPEPPRQPSSLSRARSRASIALALPHYPCSFPKLL